MRIGYWPPVTRYAVTFDRDPATDPAVVAKVLRIPEPDRHLDSGERLIRRLPLEIDPSRTQVVGIGDDVDFDRLVFAGARDRRRHVVPTAEDLNWLESSVQRPDVVERILLGRRFPSLAAWVGRHQVLAAANTGERIRMHPESGLPQVNTLAVYPAVLFAWLCHYPGTALPQLVRIAWLNGNSFHDARIEVARESFEVAFPRP